MNYRTFGKTGWQVSEICLGGAYLGGQDKDKEQENATAVVHRAFELGINYIDTAPYYGSSEELIGNALQGHQSCYIATKIGLKPREFDYKSDSVIRSIELSLSRLHIKKLSLVQVHEVNMPGWDKIMETGYALTGLREAQKRGLCERIGITGRAIPILSELAQTGEFDSVLVYNDYHPASKFASETILPVASAQSAFRYVLADKRVSTIACGASNVAEIEDVAKASDMDPLSQELIDQYNTGNQR